MLLALLYTYHNSVYCVRSQTSDCVTIQMQPCRARRWFHRLHNLCILFWHLIWNYKGFEWSICLFRSCPPQTKHSATFLVHHQLFHMIWTWPTDTLKFNLCSIIKKTEDLTACTVMQTQYCYQCKMPYMWVAFKALLIFHNTPSQSAICFLFNVDITLCFLLITGYNQLK